MAIPFGNITNQFSSHDGDYTSDPLCRAKFLRFHILDCDISTYQVLLQDQVVQRVLRVQVDLALQTLQFGLMVLAVHVLPKVQKVLAVQPDLAGRPLQVVLLVQKRQRIQAFL